MKLSKLKKQLLNRAGALDKPSVNYSSEEANKLLYGALQSESPLMVARLGAFELGMTFSILTPFNLHNIIRLLKGEIASMGYNEKIANYLCINAGFFPNNKEMIKQYANLVIEDMPYCDILGSWLPNEKYFSEELKAAKKIKLFDLEPFHHSKPYTLALKNKKVLVIHPYKKSILHQWQYREFLFGEKEILPNFELSVFKSVQSIANIPTRYNTWFEALESMKDSINKYEFDIALIGCGAYGFHLAAHVKRMGKKAIHLGGNLQILFGIMGKRWEGKYDFVNEYWIRPLKEDSPEKKDQIENGCYW